MSRTQAFTVGLVLSMSLGTWLSASTASGCKPCPDPTLTGLFAKADIVAVAEVLKVDVTARGVDAETQREVREVRWQVKLVQGMKGRPPRELTVQHADLPPCISAVVPQPGRYLMFLYNREGRISPLSYCDRALFAIDAHDRVTVTPAMSKELQLTGEQVPLTRVAALWARRSAPLPPT